MTAEPKISGLPYIHWLEHPEFYGKDEIKPLTVKPQLSVSDLETISKLTFQLDNIIESSFRRDGTSVLGEFLRPLQQASTNLNHALRGRVVPGIVLIKSSDGWLKRRVSTKEQIEGELSHV